MLWRCKNHKLLLGVHRFLHDELRNACCNASDSNASLQTLLPDLLMLRHAAQLRSAPCPARGFSASAAAAADTADRGPPKEKLTAIPFKVPESACHAEHADALARSQQHPQ